MFSFLGHSTEKLPSPPFGEETSEHPFPGFSNGAGGYITRVERELTLDTPTSP